MCLKPQRLINKVVGSVPNGRPYSLRELVTEGLRWASVTCFKKKLVQSCRKEACDLKLTGTKYLKKKIMDGVIKFPEHKGKDEPQGQTKKGSCWILSYFIQQSRSGF